MLDSLWPPSTNGESRAQEDPSKMPTQAQAVSLSPPDPSTSLKRKRATSHDTVPSLDRSRSGYMAVAVETPAMGLQISPDETGTQTDGINMRVGGTQDLKTAISDSRVASGEFGPYAASDSSVLAEVNGNTTGSSAVNRMHPSLPSIISSRALREKIESQFNLEILLKHRELRLVEQELAKCSVSLEQLRRCQIIPFPLQTFDVTSPDSISDGTGLKENSAPHAPSWGSTSDPYTRHYRRWLIPDPAFDDHEVEHLQVPSTVNGNATERATRGAMAGSKALGTSSRSQRASIISDSKALSQGYADHREEKGPMIVPRKLNGQISMVKLVCLDCRRSNFNSTQGFINHCRIAHSRQFASHDAAIEASGEEIDTQVDLAGGTGPQATQNAPSTSLVHPMIRSARPPTVENSACPFPKENGNDVADPHTLTPSVSRQEGTISGLTSGFKPSPQTPRLSMLLAKTGRDIDLSELVADAKSKVEWEALQESEPEDASDEELEETVPNSHSTRGIVHSSVRPASMTRLTPPEPFIRGGAISLASPAPRHRAPTVVQTAPHRASCAHGVARHGEQQSAVTGDATTSYNFSPNTTDPHPAPSLVSDDGEYDNTHSESETSSHADMDEEDDNHYLHADLLDHEVFEVGESSALNLAQPHKSHDHQRSRRPAAVHDNDNGERHVTFAKPPGRPRRASHVVAESM